MSKDLYDHVFRQENLVLVTGKKKRLRGCSIERMVMCNYRIFDKEIANKSKDQIVNLVLGRRIEALQAFITLMEKDLCEVAPKIGLKIPRDVANIKVEVFPGEWCAEKQIRNDLDKSTSVYITSRYRLVNTKAKKKKVRAAK